MSDIGRHRFWVSSDRKELLSNLIAVSRPAVSSLPMSWTCWGSSLAPGPCLRVRSSAWWPSSTASSAPFRHSSNRAPVKRSWYCAHAFWMPGGICDITSLLLVLFCFPIQISKHNQDAFTQEVLKDWTNLSEFMLKTVNGEWKLVFPFELNRFFWANRHVFDRFSHKLHRKQDFLSYVIFLLN